MKSRKTPVFNKTVERCIAEGEMAFVDAKNPYSAKSQAMEFHAWSAGHFDKWGRV